MASSRRRSDAPIIFQGKEVTHDFLPELHRKGAEHRWFSRYRINTARGIRLKTMTVGLRPTWKRRHPEAAEWVVKVLPERRTLERDLIAATGAVEPTYSRVAVPSGVSGGLLDRDKTYAEQLESYMETWREEYVPTQTSFEKCAEDGEHGGVILPTDVDMEGCPDFYDRLDDLAYEALDDERKAEYRQDEDDPKGRYARFDEDGAKKPNPTYDRDKDGRRRRPSDKDFERDDEKSKEAHQRAVRRYLLNQEQGACTVRIIPANDCVPFLVRGTKRDRWKLVALVERTLYYPEELLRKGYGWRGMGDSALIPQGFEATRGTGQNGMFYLYTLYTTWVDPKDPKKIERPLIAYSVGGQPTWSEESDPDQKAPDNGVSIIDLYETHGLTGAFWWYGGGLHTSDDDSDMYWEPYLWPLAETFMSLEGKETMANASVAVQSTQGSYHIPDPNMFGDGKLDADELQEDDGSFRKPKIPEPGEIETAIGQIVPAIPPMSSPDLWRSIQAEYLSLRENTTLEQSGAGAGDSGHKLVVKETIAQTAKRHIREGTLDFVKFCGERAMRIFEACEREYDVKWPLQTSKDRPIGQADLPAGSVLEWDSAWVGEGEYKLNTTYPAEYNPVRVEQAIGKIAAGIGSFEELVEASGKTDVATELAKVQQTRIWLSPQYSEMLMTRLAKRTGDKIMLKVLDLQRQNRMTQQGGPSFEAGLPSAAVGGGPSATQSALGGIKAAETGPQMQDAAATAQITPPMQGAA